MEQYFGEPDGYPPGSWFKNRKELAAAGVHRQTQAGIAGSSKIGCDSIVVSGGYPDDFDDGDEIIYTGQGGQNPSTRTHEHDQTLTRGNLALALSCDHGHPVRVIRGAGGDDAHSPPSGYRYDGLFRVVRYYWARGAHGFKIIRFQLKRLEGTTPDADVVSLPAGQQQPKRQRTVTTRIIRASAVTNTIKKLYKHCCQVCGEALSVIAGPYAEGAHIKPLGRPHHGPDIPSNVLCLCPNHHVMLDKGGFTIADDLTFNGLPGRLKQRKGHLVDLAFIRYHRSLFS